MSHRIALNHSYSIHVNDSSAVPRSETHHHSRNHRHCCPHHENASHTRTQHDYQHRHHHHHPWRNESQQGHLPPSFPNPQAFVNANAYHPGPFHIPPHNPVGHLPVNQAVGYEQNPQLRAQPELLAMSINAHRLIVADSSNSISVFSTPSASERLTWTGIHRASSRILALAVTEGGHTVLFAERRSPAVLQMFSVDNPEVTTEVSPIEGFERAQVVSCAISSHFIVASFCIQESSRRTMALWRRKHNTIDSELTLICVWPLHSVSGDNNDLYRPTYVTERHHRRSSQVYAAVAYNVDNTLCYHPKIDERGHRETISLSHSGNPVGIRVDQSHDDDYVYLVFRDKICIYQVTSNGNLCLSDSVSFTDQLCNSAVCGIWKGRINRNVTVARIVNGGVHVFQAALPRGVRFNMFA